MLIIVNFCQQCGQQMMHTIIPLYAYNLGAVASMVGVVSGAFAVAAIASRPFAGPAFDSFSKKWLLFGALCIISGATFLYGIANSVPAIIAIRILHGLGIGIAGPLSLALAVEMLPPERMAGGVGYFTLAQAAGQAIGPAIGLWIADSFGFLSTFIIAGCVQGLAAVVLFFLVEPPSSRKPYKITLNRIFAREAVFPAVLMFLLCIAYCSINSFLAIYAGLLNVEGIGLYFTVYAICLVGTRPLFGNLGDRFGITPVLIAGFVFFGLSFIVIANAQTLLGFILAAVVASCGYGASSPLIQTLAMKLTPSDRRGSATNTTFTGLDLSNLVGPAFTGAVIELLMSTTGSEVTAYSDIWLVMVVPIALSLILFIAWYRRKGAALLHPTHTSAVQ